MIQKCIGSITFYIRNKKKFFSISQVGNAISVEITSAQAVSGKKESREHAQYLFGHSISIQ